ncbi:DUF4916 domain-containing protein [Actinotalea solisilvae]|uniref:DUF4916 domain-containing protein n=1 Tax=Actinotalea solisilvae TaxID=2072922 RepID=UPI0018F20DC9|nr:DUF4916 domain-containing protein [Actinotalea solisilvae]
MPDPTPPPPGSSAPEGAAPAVLPDDQWRWASEHLPIACVDVLPVVRARDGRIVRVGLIERDSPWGRRWCHVGGRVLRGEPLRDGAVRHLEASLVGLAGDAVAAEPYLVREYFPDARPGMGVDPRKHAIASCYLAEAVGTADVAAHGTEARRFSWFPVDAVPAEEHLWPGTAAMVERAVETSGENDHLAAYEALAARQVSHNELMWQTPALAMTAMAFLLTIALGDGEHWQRGLASALSAAVALISAQLMSKHSVGAIADAEALLEMETRRGMPRVHARPDPAPQRHHRSSWSGGLQDRLARYRSRDWWFTALVAFGLVSWLLTVQAAVAWAVSG